MAAWATFRAKKEGIFELPSSALDDARFTLLLDAWEDPRPAVQDAAVIALSGGPHGFGTPDTLFDRVSHADKRRTIALYDRDASAIAEGTLTTADRSWRVGRLGDVGRMVEPYRAVVGTSPA